MISVDMIFLGTGSVLAYAFDAAFQHVAHGWRYMVGLGALPSMLLGISLFWCPESPRQLMYHNKKDCCTQVIRQIYPNATDSDPAQNHLHRTRGRTGQSSRGRDDGIKISEDPVLYTG